MSWLKGFSAGAGLAYMTMLDFPVEMKLNILIIAAPTAAVLTGFLYLVRARKLPAKRHSAR